MARGGRSDRQSEQREYQFPIPQRTEISSEMERAGRPLTLPALAARLDIHDEPHQRALENRLRAMVRDGQLIRNRAGEFCLTQHLDLVAGTVIAHRDGYGFLKPDDGSDDLYLPAREMLPLFDGDRVAVHVTESPRGRAGHVVEILARAVTAVVGTFHSDRGIEYVLEEGDARTEVLIARGKKGKARPGDIVRAEIIEYPKGRVHAVGHIVEVIGRPDSPGIETEIAILSHDIPNVWPDDVLQAVGQYPDVVTRAAKRGREDLRDTPLVTIDGADAKDFDDAVYAEADGDGWRLLVAIADVAHYVTPGSVIDTEARGRGTSVYFPDRVVPMLPEALSNGLCSLRPKVDRLCVCCEMFVTPQGKVRQSRFFEAVMRSAARLTYEQAWEMLESSGARGRDGRVRPVLDALRDVHAALEKARKRRGAIGFDKHETKIELDEYGQVGNVLPVTRLLTHRIIEECMIAANVQAALRLGRRRMPTLYRVHEGPDSERLDELMLFLKTFGYRIPPAGKLKPGDLSRILDEVSGGAEAELIETVILRSMRRAQYQPRNTGHFGLALSSYAHFTSPIRRYPDLLVHRALKWLIENGSARGFGYAPAQMEELGEHCSRTERRADEAVWDVEERLKCAYMKKRIGEEFSVIVSSVMPFGLFVRVPELHVDGLVHVSALPRDYYHRDPSGTALTGERSGQRYRLMDTMTVRLAGVDLEDRKIDFVPVDGEGGGGTGVRRERRGGRNGRR
jgi:ribonuclease R